MINSVHIPRAFRPTASRLLFNKWAAVGGTEVDSMALTRFTPQQPLLELLQELGLIHCRRPCRAL